MLFLVSAWQSFEIFWPHWRSWWGKWEMGICKTLHIMQGRTRLIIPEPWPASTDWKSATENAGRCLLLVAHFWECLQLFISLDLRNVYAKLENANCLRFSSHKHSKGKHLRRIKLKMIPLLMQNKSKHARKRRYTEKNRNTIRDGGSAVLFTVYTAFKQ